MFAPSPQCVRALVGLLVVACAVALTACAGSPGRTLEAAPATAVAGTQVKAPTTPMPRASFEGDVALLRSGDFAKRSRAADRLVAGGERALPALGRAGEGGAEVHGTSVVSTTRPVIRSILSDTEQQRLYVHLDSPWAVIRGEAADEVGRRGQWSAVPRLISKLEDGDADVRASAASSLRRLTNRFFGYDARAHQHLRADAQRRWSTWWEVQARVERTTGRGVGEG